MNEPQSSGVVLECPTLPCRDVRTEHFYVPPIAFDCKAVEVVLISESAAADAKDGYYAEKDALFVKTTLQAFNDAGVPASSIGELIEMGVYLTTAVKCAKVGYGISLQTIKNCTALLAQELAQFPNMKCLLLMGDVAIRAVNEVAKQQGEKRVIPAGSTYKIRGGKFFYHGARLFPSYLQAGPSFYIEKSKRKMIAEDIASAMQLVRTHMI